jgi:hypothetical protein
MGALLFICKMFKKYSSVSLTAIISTAGCQLHSRDTGSRRITGKILVLVWLDVDVLRTSAVGTP